jgi:hypothetical protein
VSMQGHFICDTKALFTSVLDYMRQREVLLQSRAVYRGQSDPRWPLQSLWERQFLHPQRAGPGEPYYIQPHEGGPNIQRQYEGSASGRNFEV